MAITWGAASPASAPRNQLIIINFPHGAGFSAITAARVSYTIASNRTDIPVPFIVLSDTAFQMSSASIPAGINLVTLGVNDGTGWQGFSYAINDTPPVPTITLTNPVSGGPGTSVRVTGTNLDTVTSVTFGGVPANITDRGFSWVVATAPAGLAGSQPVVVTNPYGTAQTTFAYPSPPTITNITPASGNPGDRITLTGTNLDTTTSVTVAGINAPIIARTATSLGFNAPSGTRPIAGAQPVIVTTPAGQASTTFNYPPPVPPQPSTNRQAHLTLGSRTLPLDDYATGYACMQLDLGYPDVRDVVNNRPNQDGTDDRTTLWGARVVQANITAWPGGSATIDDIAALFAPFLQPSARPVLHWNEWSNSRLSERTLRLRASAFSSPMPAANKRDLQLSWVASDPVIQDSTIQTATAWAGNPGLVGRVYPLTFYRLYPVGSSPPINAQLRTNGDVGVFPFLRLYGPVTGPYLMMNGPAGTPTQWFYFMSAFQIQPGHFVDISGREHTVNLDGDPTQSLLNQVDWSRTTWLNIQPGSNYLLSMLGGSTSGVTQTQASWQDGYLT